MKFSNSAVVLATLAAGQAMAASMAHHAFPKHNHAARHVESMIAQQEKRAGALISAESILSNSIGSKNLISGGLNPTSSNSFAWIGSDGPFTNTFHNAGGEDLVLVVWGAAGSWVNAIQPHFTLSIPKGTSQTLSFANGASGAFAPIYKDTVFSMGQISDTWGEFTFNSPYSVVDVSREVNMNGRNLAIVGPQCTSDMNKCVFKCAGGATTCMTGYELVDCATGSQAGANFGTYEGAASGGCGGMGTGAQLNTYFNGASSY